MSTRLYSFHSPDFIVDYKHDTPGTYEYPPMHIHNVYEFTYIVSGQGIYYIEGTPYPVLPGSILLIPPMVAHISHLDLSTVYERVIFQFSQEVLDQIDPDGIITNFINTTPSPMFSPTSSHAAFFMNLYKQLPILIKAPSSYQKNILYSILLFILFTLSHTQASSATAPSPLYNSISDTIRNILQYINEHLVEDFTLDALCVKFGISKSYLNKRFKEIYGTTLWNYVLVKRLTLARQQIRDGIPILEASKRCGFNDYSSFYRCFVKHFGLSPKEDSFTNTMNF